MLAALMSFGADQPGTFSLSTITAGLPQNLTSIVCLLFRTSRATR
jgi:hypothetical protein